MDNAAVLSEPIPYQTIARSALGGPAEAARAVITNEEEYRHFFNGSPPPHPEIDYRSSLVVAVAMGTQASSGHSIEITSIDQITAGSSAGALVVHYAEKHPDPGSFVSHIVTAPFHVVTCPARAVGTVTFIRT